MFSQDETATINEIATIYCIYLSQDETQVHSWIINTLQIKDKMEASAALLLER